LLLLIALLARTPQQPSEYQLKAAFLLNFTKFVEWPQRPRAGVAHHYLHSGEDPFGATLNQLLEGEVERPKSGALRSGAACAERAGSLRRRVGKDVSKILAGLGRAF
jgi:hypothetical protein